MDRTLTLILTEELAREGAKRYLLQQIDWKLKACLLVLAVCLTYLILTENYTFLVGVGTAILGFSLVFLYLGYRRLSQNAFETLRKRKNEPAILVFGEAGLTLSSTIGMVKLEWNDIEALWEFEDLALLTFDGGGYVVLPSSCVGKSDLLELEAAMTRGKKADA